MSQPQLARNQPPHPLQSLDRRRVSRQELFRQPHRAQRKANSLLNALALGERNLAASAAQIHQQHTARCANHRSGFGLSFAATHHAQMNQPAFFQAGDDLQIPARLGFHHRLKDRSIARVAHGRSSDGPNLVHPVRLHRPLKTLERLQCRRHRIRRNQPALKDASPQPRHLAVLVQRLQLMRRNLGNLQSARVGTDINGGKCRHEYLIDSNSLNQSLLPTYTTGPALCRLSWLSPSKLCCYYGEKIEEPDVLNGNDRKGLLCQADGRIQAQGKQRIASRAV
jgi:hypothetical protein